MQIPCNASIEFNIWIMAIFISFTYSITLQNRMVTLMMIFHIFIKGLIILKGPNDVFPNSLIHSYVSLKWNNKTTMSSGTFFDSQHFGGKGVW
jgi:hypothetical protein